MRAAEICSDIKPVLSCEVCQPELGSSTDAPQQVAGATCSHAANATVAHSLLLGAALTAIGRRVPSMPLKNAFLYKSLSLS